MSKADAVAFEYAKENGTLGLDYNQIYDAVKYGYNQARKQLLSKSIDGVIAFDYYGNDNKTYGCIAHDSFCLEDFGLKDNDNVKMIIVK